MKNSKSQKSQCKKCAAGAAYRNAAPLQKYVYIRTSGSASWSKIKLRTAPEPQFNPAPVSKQNITDKKLHKIIPGSASCAGSGLSSAIFTHVYIQQIWAVLPILKNRSLQQIGTEFTSEIWPAQHLCHTYTVESKNCTFF
jgi:hypothetical protein